LEINKNNYKWDLIYNRMDVQTNKLAIIYIFWKFLGYTTIIIVVFVCSLKSIIEIVKPGQTLAPQQKHITHCIKIGLGRYKHTC
jgi:hypothetical protein